MKEPEFFDKRNTKAETKEGEKKLKRFLDVYMPTLRRLANEIDPSGQNQEDLIQQGLLYIYPYLDLLNSSSGDRQPVFSLNIADLIFAHMQEYYESSLKPFEISEYIQERLMGTGAVSDGEDTLSLMDRLQTRKIFEEKLVPTLKPKEVDTLRLRIGLVKEDQLINGNQIPEHFTADKLMEGLSLREIGEILGLTAERIRQAENKVLLKLRGNKFQDTLNGIPPAKIKKLNVPVEWLVPKSDTTQEPKEISDASTTEETDSEPEKKRRKKTRKRASVETIETRKHLIKRLHGLRLNYNEETNNGRYPLSVLNIEYPSQSKDGSTDPKLELLRVLDKTYEEARPHFQEIHFSKTRYPLGFKPQFMNHDFWSHPHSMLKLTNRLYLLCEVRRSKGEYVPIYNFIRPIDATRLLLCIMDNASRAINWVDVLQTRETDKKPWDSYDRSLRRDTLAHVINTAKSMLQNTSVYDVYEKE